MINLNDFHGLWGVEAVLDCLKLGSGGIRVEV